MSEMGTDYHNDGAAKANVIVMATDSITAAALASSATAEMATAWGASVVGNSRTRDEFLQGAINKLTSDTPSAGFTTLFGTDDATPLRVYASTSSAVDPITSLDPV